MALVERKQQKRCPSGGGTSNVEVLVLERNDINVVAVGGDKLNTMKVKGK